MDRTKVRSQENNRTFIEVDTKVRFMEIFFVYQQDLEISTLWHQLNMIVLFIMSK